MISPRPWCTQLGLRLLPWVAAAALFAAAPAGRAAEQTEYAPFELSQYALPPILEHSETFSTRPITDRLNLLPLKVSATGKNADGTLTVTAGVDGEASLTVTAFVGGNTVSIKYPVSIRLRYPEDGTVYPDDPFEVIADVTFLNDADHHPLIQTTSPTYTASVVGEAHVTPILTATVGADTVNLWKLISGSESIGQQYTFFKIQSDPPKLVVLGDEKSIQARGVTSVGQGLTLAYHLNPELAAVGGPVNADSLACVASDNFLGLSGSVTEAIMKQFFGQNKLHDAFDYGILLGLSVGADYNLLDLRADSIVSAEQSSTFTAKVGVTLVDTDTGKRVVLGGTEPPVFPPAKAGSDQNRLVLQPEFDLSHNQLETSTDLVLEPNLALYPLGVGARLNGTSVPYSYYEFPPIAIGPTQILLGHAAYRHPVGGFGVVTAKQTKTILGYRYPRPVLAGLSAGPTSIPNLRRAGGKTFTLTLDGIDFVPAHGTNPSSVVRIDGSDRATAYASATKLTAAIPETDIALEGVHQVTVFNPPPNYTPDGGSSVLLPLWVDGTPPKTTPVLAGLWGNNGWWRGNVTVGLPATDNLAVLSGVPTLDGVAATYYTLDAAGPVTYKLPFVVTGDLIHSVGYWSVDQTVEIDGFGNEETHQFQQIKLDATPPVLTAAPNTPLIQQNNGKLVPIIISGKMTDNLSGVDLTSATFAVADEYKLVQPAGKVVVAADGSYAFTIMLQASRLSSDFDGRIYTVTVKATNIAGNPSSGSTRVTVPHDTKPTTP